MGKWLNEFQVKNWVVSRINFFYLNRLRQNHRQDVLELLIFSLKLGHFLILSKEVKFSLPRDLDLYSGAEHGQTQLESAPGELSRLHSTSHSQGPYVRITCCLHIYGVGDRWVGTRRVCFSACKKCKGVKLSSVSFVKN